MMRADLLTAPIAGLDEAMAAVEAFDRTLIGGLLRPRPEQAAGLVALADAVAGTPLADRVAEAADKAAAGAAGEEHLVALAGARAAVLGAVHDALVARIDEASGRTRVDVAPTADEAAGSAASPALELPPPNLLAAARSWLADLARAGWQGIDHELVSGSAQIVSAMLPVPSARRLATLLDGFAAELAASCPGATLERIPVRRWADLWSRAMLLTEPQAVAVRVGTATGRLLPLGIDLHEHATAVQAQVHAVFEPADGSGSRLVRASVSAPKPDTVIGMGVWQLLRPHMSLLAAFSEGRSMDLTDMPVTAEGDLLWNDANARPGEPADPFATARVALPTATATATAPLDRHPTRIAEVVFLEGKSIEFDTDRIPTAGPLTPKAAAAASACIGLVRWDAGTFTVHPLAVETMVKKQAVVVHAGAWAGGTADKDGLKAEAAATAAVEVLRERAGKLLRK